MMIISEKAEVLSKSVIREVNKNKPNDRSISLQEVLNKMKENSIPVVILRITNNL